MKTISLREAYQIARSLPYGQFEQEIKVMLTGQPYTVVIDCTPIVTQAKGGSGEEYVEGDRCLKCFHTWTHEDDACPECGSQNVDNGVMLKKATPPVTPQDEPLGFIESSELLSGKPSTHSEVGETTYKCDMCETDQVIEHKQVFKHEWYTPPSGCTDGDYWNHGYYYILCECGRRIEIAEEDAKKDVPVPTREQHPGVCPLKPQLTPTKPVVTESVANVVEEVLSQVGYQIWINGTEDGDGDRSLMFSYDDNGIPKSVELDIYGRTHSSIGINTKAILTKLNEI